MNNILYELNAPICHEDDIGVYSPETSLYLRWEALCERKQELENKSSAYSSDTIWSNTIWMESDLRYVLPEDFYSMRNVMQAIDIAEWDLRTKYGIEVSHISAAREYTKPIQTERFAA